MASPPQGATIASVLLDSVEDAIVVIAPDLSIVYLNSAAREAAAIPDDAAESGLLGNAFDLVHADDRDYVAARLAATLDVAGAAEEARFRIYRAGGVKHVRARATNHLDTAGIGGIVVCFRDLDHEVELDRFGHQLQAALETTSDLVLLLAHDGTLLHANRTARGVLETSELPDTGFVARLPEGVRRKLLEHVLPGVHRDQAWSGTLDVETSTGHRFLSVVATKVDPQLDRSELAVTCRDVTDRMVMQHRLAYEAAHDSLTGVANRASLIAAIDEALAGSGANPLATLFIDLDRFKMVNDTFGHQIGDQILVEVTGRLRNALRKDDFLARLGGDEFVVMVRAGDPAELARLTHELAARVHAALDAPFTVGGSRVHLGASIGVAEWDGGSAATELLRNADVAMYSAKSRGRNGTAFYSSDLGRVAEHRLRIELDLREALDSGAMVVLYQPIVDARDGAVRGFEALVRWQHDSGLLSPASFLEVAERSDLVTRIDSFVLSQALADLARWRREAGGADLYVSVNLSARQLRRSDLADEVLSELARHGVPAHALQVEITETTLMTDRATATATLDRLRGYGVRIAIDDFGTGYSSLSYLRFFRPHVVKIDRSFVEHAVDNELDTQIMRAIRAIAESFGMHTVAEGVETSEQLAAVTSIGCDGVQGYFLGRPVRSARAAELIRAAAAVGLPALR